jgi:Protein of unknown function (DUF2442)
MYASIVQVVPMENFLLEIAFDNGQKRRLDMKPYLDFGIFSRIKEPDKFKRVHVAFDTIEWECGADLDPEFVMSKSNPI